MSDEYLPAEVVLEILRKLPVKSVAKCRLVCKTWNNLIKTPNFISTHFQASDSNPQNHLLLFLKHIIRNNNGEFSFSLFFENHELDEFKNLRIPLAFNQCLKYIKMVGCCYGLVCLKYGSDPFDFIFWNPVVQKYIKLPSTPYISKMSYGFGFDSRTNDYKVFVGPRENIKTSSEAYLFSLNENSWKRVTACFPKDFVQIQSSATFVNGAFHWIGFLINPDGRCINMILGFDISTEEYFVIKLSESFVLKGPEGILGLQLDRLFVMKYEESSIAIFNNFWVDDKKVELWAMKKYGEVGSWTKVLHLTEESGFGCILTAMGFKKNGEVLLRAYAGRMFTLDLNSYQSKHFAIEETYWINSVDNYVESLVLVDKGVNVGCVSYANDSTGIGIYASAS